MPALPAITGLLRVLLQYTLAAGPTILNRLFFQGSGSTSSTALNTWAGNVATNWGTNIKGSLVPALTLTGVTVEDLTSSISPVGATSVSIAGTSTHLDPPGVEGCLIIKNITAFRSRGGHSRTYIAGFPNSNLLSSSATNWNSASAAGFVTNWVAFIGSITGASGPAGYTGLAQVVPNYYHGFTVVTNPITGRARNVPKLIASPTTNAVTSHVANTVLGTQRRRTHQSV